MRALLWLIVLACCVPVAAATSTPAPLALDGYSAIQLTRMKTGHLTLHAQINGVSGRFILDTGAGRSVVEASRMTKFRLGPVDKATGAATGTGGAVPLKMSHGNRLQVGPFIDAGFTAYLMPLDQVNLAFLRRGQERIDGVIGADVLNQGHAVIDYPRRLLYLKPASAGVTPHQPTTGSASR